MNKPSLLSAEAVAELLKNPNIKDIYKSTVGHFIMFKAEFREMACRELLEGKKTIREILREHGIDPDLLGRERIIALTRRFRKNAIKRNDAIVSKKSEATGKSKYVKVELSEETIAKLQANPAIAVAHCNKVLFKPEFNELISQELLQGKKTMREILKEHGVDPELLGERRIVSIAYYIRKKAQKVSLDINSKNCHNKLPYESEIIDDMDSMIERAKPFEPLGIETDDTSEIAQDIATQKIFTEEERLELLNSSYVLTVTNDSIQFTEEFKELAYRAILETNKNMREIFHEYGINPEILGSKRIWNFTSKLREKAKKSQGFGDARVHNKRRPTCTPIEEKALTERIRTLEHELAYTRQEVEFLKKTQAADMEARILWEFKQNQKKNSR